ncbi:sensor histidine kinase [Paenibacillus thalictri]|uniref:histidine kinase n=1 Tax=Paenibacillus thalictri TaxID=2527873 RepID=A0A4Q9DWQ0_9BACL|nr:ATP-binding protein [Paenibacillus thalictri]TBL80177.1 HAMP domain-containing sensor histidine kinase [Paenibacillus thalictri]
MVKRWLGSLYLKIFLSFLATCVLFFIGLAVFWNYYFTELFYKDKKNLLQSRFTEITRILPSFQEGTMSTRELRFGLRIIARSINGQVWLVDSKGNILNGSSELENTLIPQSMDQLFIEGLKGRSGFTGSSSLFGGKTRDGTLTFYAPERLNGQPIVVFLQAPAVELSDAIAAVRVNIVVPLIFSLIAVAVVLYSLSRKLAGPLQQMNQAAIDLANGDFTTRVPVTSTGEIGQLARSFNFMVDQLENWENSRQEFLANVSHELRSPLTTLRGLIVAMNDKVIPEEKYSYYLKLCEHEMQRLQRLVVDLLDLARIQNGNDVFLTRPVLLKHKIEEVLEVIHKRVEEKGITVRTELGDGIHGPLQALLDPDRFAQILQNLLYNAIQFTPAGGYIDVRLFEEEDNAVIVLKDSGIGMTKEELVRIWERFYKAEQSRLSQSDGTGLGLTIVKHLVGGMGGHIYVNSEVGHGTEFTVVFPQWSDAHLLHMED